MTAQPIPLQTRRPAGSPVGGQFAPTARPESDIDLAPTDRDWVPCDADFADVGEPLPRYVYGTKVYDSASIDEAEYGDDMFGSDFPAAELDRAASDAEDRWFRGTLAGG